MDYSTQTDPEINKAVTLAVLNHRYSNAKSIEWDDRQSVFWVETIGFSSCPVLDYCNNPADGWRIISEQKINIDWFTDGERVLASCGGLIYQSTNPLRAACVLYLMMNEQ